jgi:hypothetical protein
MANVDYVIALAGSAFSWTFSASVFYTRSHLIKFIQVRFELQVKSKCTLVATNQKVIWPPVILVDNEYKISTARRYRLSLFFVYHNGLSKDEIQTN